MKLEQSFEVAAPVDRVWEALIDVERVAPCLPGAAVTGRNEDGSFSGTFSVKIGPTSASYTGRLEMEAVDEGAHTATMQAQGTDKRGQGGAKATIASSLSELDGRLTRVEVVTDYRITGRLARFGRGGMIEDISEKLLREFARCLQESLAAGDPAAPSASPSSLSPSPSSPSPSSSSSPSSSPSSPPSSPPPSSEEAPPPAPTPPAPPSESINGLSLLASVLWTRIRRNPAPLAAAIVALLLVRRRTRRR